MKKSGNELSSVGNDHHFPVANHLVVVSFKVDLNLVAHPPMDFFLRVNHLHKYIGMTLFEEIQVAL